MDSQTLPVIAASNQDRESAPGKPWPDEMTYSPIWEAKNKATYLNLGFTLLCWLLIASLHALAFYKDTLRDPTTANILLEYASILPGYILLATLSCTFAVVLSKNTGILLKPRNILAVCSLTLLLGLPILTALALSMETLVAHHDLAGFKFGINKRSGFAYFIDTTLLLFAYLMQAAFAFWIKVQAEGQAYSLQNNESLALRLRLLQGQLKPHFLFNALNSISALVRTADRELASDALEKLSALLRYVLHSSKHEWLSVSDEINFTKAYLDMQMLRYGERTSITWHLANVPWEKLACPPLLFQPLVENAIHHGVEQNHEICHIQINLLQRGDILEFHITSPVFKQGCSKKGHGLGLSASTDRLAILYGQRAALRTEASTDRYTATLEFPLRFLQPA
ncbi:sensor histidine kinase [Undibacterium sp. JH2W]|uniref:sensor histidine kinase n=1 Tax=Undibacterium sp. JH2W TaxID=3413037 RepID=UPI003BF05B35